MNAILLSVVLLSQASQLEMFGQPPSVAMMSKAHVAAEYEMFGEVSAPSVRGVMITAPWCRSCVAFKANEVPRLIKGGWKVGDRETDHLQLKDVGNESLTLPVFIRLVDGKEVARHVGSMDALQLAEFVYPVKPQATGDESAPTPTREVERVLDLLPKPAVAFVDFGCGDGRWLFAAAERWNCKAIGVEIDPVRAEATRDRVRSLGLSDHITIITGNATTTEVVADVGVAYLYGETLERLRPKIERLRAFASYLHRPPGLPVTRNGDSWFYAAPAASQSHSAVWQGQSYSQPVCNSPGCAMCRSIRSQLNSGSQRQSATEINPPSGSIWWSLLERK